MSPKGTCVWKLGPQVLELFGGINRACRRWSQASEVENYVLRFHSLLSLLDVFTFHTVDMWPASSNSWQQAFPTTTDDAIKSQALSPLSCFFPGIITRKEPQPQIQRSEVRVDKWRRGAGRGEGRRAGPAGLWAWVLHFSVLGRPFRWVVNI